MHRGDSEIISIRAGHSIRTLRINCKQENSSHNRNYLHRLYFISYFLTNFVMST